MHDIKAIRADGPAFDAAIARRGVGAVSAGLIALDQRLRDLKTAGERDVAAQNDLARQIGRAKGQGDDALAARLLAEVAALKAGAGAGGEAIAGLEAEQRDGLAAFPNLPAAEVPDGLDEHGNIVVHERGSRPDFAFAPAEHDVLALRLGYDPDAAAAIAGARFAVLKGPVARLHRALGQWMLDTQVAAGYTEVNPPLLVRPEAVFGVGQLPKFEEDLFKTTDNPPRYLISTSEVSLTNLVRERILDR